MCNDLKADKIKIKYDIKIIKINISLIKYELKHNKKLCYDRKNVYIIRMFRLKKELNNLKFRLRCLKCL